MSKTNAVRILDSHKINYSLHTYDVDEDDLTGITVAIKIGADPNSVFKTLVAKGDKTEIIVLCVPTSEEVNFKKAAFVSNNKRVDLVNVKDLFGLTGYIRGGCSPIGMKKNFPTFIDETAQLFDKIYISAGIRGMQVKVSPNDLAPLTKAFFCDLI